MSVGRWMVPAVFHAMPAAQYDAAINYQHLTEENCRFLFGPDSKVTIVTASPDDGLSWNAYLYKMGGGRRQLLCSVSSTNLAHALRSIHTVSAEQVAVRAREKFMPRVPMPMSGSEPGPVPPPPPPPFPLHTGIAGGPSPRFEAADGDLCEDGDTDDDAASVISDSDIVATPTSTVSSHRPGLFHGQSVLVDPEDMPGPRVAEKAGNGVDRQDPALRERPPPRQPPNGFRLPLHQARRFGPPSATTAAEGALAKAVPLREHDVYFQLQSPFYGSLTVRARCYVEYDRVLRMIHELIEKNFSSFTLVQGLKPTLSQIRKLDVSAERVIADGKTFVLQNKKLDFSRITCGSVPHDLTVVADIIGSLDD